MSISSITLKESRFAELLAGSGFTAAIIDPGTSMAIRYCEYHVRALAPGSNGVQCRILGQAFISSKAMGKNYVERIARIDQILNDDELFKTADVYIIEAQFELNVAISVGVILGILSGIRRDGIKTRVKRGSGVVTIDDLGYDVFSVPSQFKSQIILEQTGSKPTRANIKELGNQAALKLCTAYDDEATLNLMADSSKIDDISDTVCYGEALLKFLNSIVHKTNVRQ